MQQQQSNPAAVEFYWRPGCPFCSSLKHQLKKRGIPMDMRNIWDDPESAKIVRKAAGGNETVPTVGIGGTFLVNPSPDAVLKLIRSKNPELAATISERPKKRWGSRRR